MPSLEDKCAKAGLKMTAPRRAILRVLEEAVDHPPVNVIYDRAKIIDESVSIATVYRTLNLLEQLDLIQKHDFKEGATRFETNTEHHHHLFDIETGEVTEFQDERLEKLKQEIAKELGYELVDHILELYGKKLDR